MNSLIDQPVVYFLILVYNHIAQAGRRSDFQGKVCWKHPCVSQFERVESAVGPLPRLFKSVLLMSVATSTISWISLSTVLLYKLFWQYCSQVIPYKAFNSL